MADEPPAAVREALALVRDDPELASWWEREREFDRKFETAVNESTVPPGLKANLLAQSDRRQQKKPRKITRFPRLMPLAASFIALLFVGVLLFDPIPAEAEPELDDFMGHVSSHQPDLNESTQTSDLVVVLSELKEEIGSAPDRLPQRLRDLRPAAVQSTDWRGAVIGVVVMKDPNGNTLHLYLVESARFPDRSEHPVEPEVRRIRNTTLLVWSEEPYLYALSGPQAKNFITQEF